MTKLSLALLLALAVSPVAALGQSQVGGHLFSPSSSDSLLGGSVVTFTADADCNILTQTNCTVTAISDPANTSAAYTYALTVTSAVALTAPRHMTIATGGHRPYAICNYTSGGQPIIPIGPIGLGAGLVNAGCGVAHFDGSNVVFSAQPTGTGILLNPTANQGTKQPAGTTFAPNTFGGTGPVGGQNLCSQFSSFAACLADANTYQRGAINDAGVIGFDNPNDVAMDWPNNFQQHWAGFVTPQSLGAPADGVHDDAPKILQCLTTSSTWQMSCKLAGAYRLNTPIIVNGISNWELVGNASGNGAIITCAVTGYCFQFIGSNPIQSTIMQDFTLNCLDTATGCGFVDTSGFTTGVSDGWWGSVTRNLQVHVQQGRCWNLIGGTTNTTPNPINQFLSFDNVQCNGYAGTHSNSVIEMTGLNNQITFTGSSQVNGDGSFTDYPNALINMQPNGGGNDGPTFVALGTMTVQGGVLGVSGKWTSGFSWKNGYTEGLQTAAAFYFPNDAIDISGLTLRRPVSSSGLGWFHFDGGSKGSVTANSFDPVQPVLATCSNQNTIDFRGNHAWTSVSVPTQNCATTYVSFSSGTLTAMSTTAFYGSSTTPITVNTLVTPANPGNTFTLYNNNTAPVTLTNTDNMRLGNFPSPVVVPLGCAAYFVLMDDGSNYHLISAPCSLPTVGEIDGPLPGGGGAGTAPFLIPSIVSTNTGATAGIPVNYVCSISGSWNGTSAQMTEIATCTPTNSNLPQLFTSIGQPRGSEAFVATQTALTTTGTPSSGQIAAFSGAGTVTAATGAQIAALVYGVAPPTIYSAAGTALPTCTSGLLYAQLVVSDATTPTYLGAYTSGGAALTPVVCTYNGTSYAWQTH